MNKRIKKKLESRMFFSSFKEYKTNVGKPYKEYVRGFKVKHRGKPKMTEEEMQDLIDIGIYREDEIRNKFEIVKTIRK